MKKIYLAGPDVFELNAVEIGINYKKICLDFGFKSLFPFDNEIEPHDSPHHIAMQIFEANLKFIQEADLVIANLNPFRGKEADSGTVWECGYAKGLGKPVYGYMDKKINYLDTFAANEKKMIDGMICDKNNKIIENFLLPINLMISCSTDAIIEGTLKDVLINIKEKF